MFSLELILLNHCRVEKFGRVCERRIFRVNESRNSEFKYTRMVDDGRINVAMNGKLLEKVECFK